MSGENNFKDTVNSLFKGMDAFISAKTVVGDAIHVGDTIILPLVDVSFGVGAGAFEGDKKSNGGGGMTGKLTPSAVLVIQNGTPSLLMSKFRMDLPKFLIWFLILLRPFCARLQEIRVLMKQQKIKEYTVKFFPHRIV